MFIATIGIVAHVGVGFPAAGTLLSVSCEETNSYDANNTYWNGAFLAVGVYADGTGGSYTATIGSGSNGCWYPSGYLYSYSYGDLTIQWSHSSDWGIFTYGYSSNGQASDGAGGAYSFYDSNITAGDNQIVHSYESYDSMNNWNVNEVLYFDLETTSLVTASWPVAGTVLSEGCTTTSSTDAYGTVWDNVGVLQKQIANGSGSYTYENTFNTAECGYLPYGYLTSYSTNQAVLYYNDYDGYQQSFHYANEVFVDQQDGSGNSYPATATDYLVASGYVFYSYYDAAGGQYVHYNFDGFNGYYITYEMV